MHPVAILWETLLLTNFCVCVYISVHVYVCIDILASLFFAVWWGVQRTAGGPGRVSKAGRENQRVGGEDPDPGVSGKSIKRNPSTLQNSVRFDYMFLKLYVFQKSMKKDTLLISLVDVFKWKTHKMWNKNVCLIAEKSNGAARKMADLVRTISFHSTYKCASAVSGSYHPCKNIWFNKGSISLSFSSLYGRIALLKLFLCNSIITEMDCISFPGLHIISSQAKPSILSTENDCYFPLNPISNTLVLPWDKRAVCFSA